MPKITFIYAKDQERHEVEAPVGISVLEVAQLHNIDLDGACEGALACAMCHVIISPEWYSKLPPATEQEEDMLDLAFGITPTSRLACQIIIEEKLNGLVVTIPAATRNIK